MDPTNTDRIDEEVAYEELLTQIKASGIEYKHLSTTGRGGLCLLQKLAYDLDIEDIQLSAYPVRSGTLFIDDIECTSKTLSGLDTVCDTAVLVQRESSEKLATYVGTKYIGEKYIQFSWEATDG